MLAEFKTNRIFFFFLGLDSPIHYINVVDNIMPEEAKVSTSSPGAQISFFRPFLAQNHLGLDLGRERRSKQTWPRFLQDQDSNMYIAILRSCNLSTHTKVDLY